MTDEVTKLAVMGNNLEYVKKDIAEIKDLIKDLGGVYATQLALEAVKKMFSERLDILEKSSNLWKWASPALAATVAVVIQFLVIQYLQHLK